VSANRLEDYSGQGVPAGWAACGTVYWQGGLAVRQWAGDRVYLQGGLAVGHCGRALGSDHHRQMEAVVAECHGGPCHAEGLRHGVPGLLAEDGVHQLDDLVLCVGGERKMMYAL